MVSSELISVGKRIHERQQAYLFAAGQQALGYLEYYQPPERAANQGIRAFWLQLSDSIEVELRHCFD